MDTQDWRFLGQLPQMYGTDAVFHPSAPVLARFDVQEQFCEVWHIDSGVLAGSGSATDKRYRNAKVVLMGDTSVGKSGLALVLTGHNYEVTESTHGRKVWTFGTWEVDLGDGRREEREILLWDLAGQAGYRLIHQLHLAEVAVAIVVFDARNDVNPLTGVHHWLRALAQARRLEGGGLRPVTRLLVSARADRGGISMSMQRVAEEADGLGFDGYFETSAKEHWGVGALSEAIAASINWERQPEVSHTALFQQVKAYLVQQRRALRMLVTVDDLYAGFIDAAEIDLSAHPRAVFDQCISRVESRGLIRRLSFGDFVLLQPELLDVYASAIVQTARAHPEGLGTVSEGDVINCQLRIAADERIESRALERVLLVATIDELIRHDLVIKEPSESGTDLIFPSEFTRAAPPASCMPAREILFSFEGATQNVYATLVVRLSHSSIFSLTSIWDGGATFQTSTGGECGFEFTDSVQGRAEIALYFWPNAAAGLRYAFEEYVATHLYGRSAAGSVARNRLVICPAFDCRYSIPESLWKRRLSLGDTSMLCPLCEKTRVSIEHDPVDANITGRAAELVAEMERNADESRAKELVRTTVRGRHETGDFDVFLSYRYSDRAEVVDIARSLVSAGVSPWLDTWSVRPGSRGSESWRTRSIEFLASRSLWAQAA